MLPTGKAQLVIALHDTPIAWSADRANPFHAWTGGIVHGPQSSYYLTAPKPRGTVVGVSFRPGAAGALLGVGASELADAHVPIGDVLGADGNALRDRLIDAATPAMALGLLEAALVARVRRPLLLHPAVAHALQASHSGATHVRVTQIQRETGYSPRHFIALFRAAVGLTPKQYLRIQRFGHVVDQLASGHVHALSALAAAAGYSDQSHLTRAFRELAGVTPTEYRPWGPASAHHHLVPSIGL